jgi:hypothetical protein
MQYWHLLQQAKFTHFLSVFAFLISFQVGIGQSLYPQKKKVALSWGDRLRISASKLKMKRDVVTFLYSKDNLIVIKADSEMDILLSSISRLDLSLGRYRKIGEGIAIGGFVGIIGGTILGSIGKSFCEDDFFGPPSEDCGKIIPESIVIGGLGGIAIGGLIGLIKKERWKRVPLNQLHIDFIPQSESGIGLRVLFRF